jgi:hypothetical protein
MQLIIATFVLLFVLRWLAAWLLRAKGNNVSGNGVRALLGFQSFRKEVVAWLVAIGGLAVLFVVVLVGSYFFGGIPPIHEWGN